MCFSTICRTSNILFTSCPPICTCLPLVDLWPCWSCVPWFSLYGCAGQSFIGKAAMHHYLSDFEFLEGFSGIIDSYLLFQDFTFTAQEACWSYCHWNSEQWSTPEDLDNIVNLWIGHGPHFWHVGNAATPQCYKFLQKWWKEWQSTAELPPTVFVMKWLVSKT